MSLRQLRIKINSLLIMLLCLFTCPHIHVNVAERVVRACVLRVDAPVRVLRDGKTLQTGPFGDSTIVFETEPGAVYEVAAS